MSDETFLGLDLGTSGLRGLLIDQQGEVIAEAQAEYTVSHPQTGWSEQDPAEWLHALDEVVASLRQKAGEPFAVLSGIGVSGHMHGAVLLDEKGEVLRPCILWNDTRSHVQAAALDAAPGVRELSGNIVFPGFTAPKLLWVEAHEAEIFAQVHKVLLPAAFLNYYLTGDFVGDMSDAAGTSWLDVAARDWSSTLLDAAHMRLDQMPRLVEGSEKAGMLRADLAQKWGLASEVTVAGGAGDNAAAACGVGALAEGDGFVSLGTSGVLLTARNGFAPRPETAVHTFCHAVPDRWYQMGVILSATDSLNWLSRQLGASPAELTAALGDGISGPGNVHFLPYLSGERTPHNDSAIRGAFLGIDIATDQNALTQAVLEGVGFALRDSLEALRATGAAPTRLLAIGGGSKSTYWMKLLATILDMPLDLPAQGEFGAAMGAARLGLCAATGKPAEEVMTKPMIDRTITPRSDLTEAYDARYRAWRRIYPALKELT
ncbi:MAG: xylulokinase [Pseudomonadota bacterium]